MQYDRLTTGLAVVLGGLTVVLTVLGLFESPAVLFLALMFGAATYFVYYHASGRMADRVYRRVERQARVDGGRRRQTGAGPREEWEPPRDSASARQAGARGRGAGQRGQRQQRQRRQQRGRRQSQRTGRAPSAGSDLSAAEAYSRLGLDPGADQSAVKSAYREKVKEVHPDTDEGDEQSFKRVKEAYERLSD